MKIAPLAPMGAGPNVESLTSYVRRLARCHRVPVSFFLRVTVLEPLRRERRQRDPMIQPTRATESVGGVGAVPATLVDRLQDLTGRTDLRPLTWLGRDAAICLREALRATRAWCPACVREDGDRAYDRLAWTLKELRACSLHDVGLADRCARASCRATQPPLATWAHPSRCHACGSPLADAQPNGLTPSSRARVLTLAVVLPGLLAGEIDAPRIRGDIRRAVARAGGVRPLARANGISAAELIAVRDGVARPHLARYLDVLTGCAGPRGRGRHPRPEPPGRVGAILARAVRRRTVPSLRAVAKEIATTPATLRARWPELSSQLLAARADQIRTRAEARTAARTREIRAAVTEARRRGDLRRRVVERLLPRAGLFRAPWARRALRAAVGHTAEITR